MFRPLVFCSVAVALFANVRVASAQIPIFDSLTGATTYVSPASTTDFPHATAVGEVLNLGNLGAASNPVGITGSDFLLSAHATASYTDVQVVQYFWATSSHSLSSSTPVYSNLLGSFTYDLGAKSFIIGSNNFFNEGPNSFGSPIILANLSKEAQIGFSEVVFANSGNGLVLNDNLLPEFTEGEPAVGTSGLGIYGINNFFYLNDNNESTGNFTGMEGTNLGHQDFLGLRLYAQVPEPSTEVICFAAVALVIWVTRRRYFRLGRVA